MSELTHRVGAPKAECYQTFRTVETQPNEDYPQKSSCFNKFTHNATSLQSKSGLSVGKVKPGSAFMKKRRSRDERKRSVQKQIESSADFRSK